MKGHFMPVTKSKRPPKQAGMPWLTPNLTVQDIIKSMEFYERAFGFERGMTMHGLDGKIIHGQMNYKKSVIVMLGLEGAGNMKCKSPSALKVNCPVNLYVYCNDVDELFDRARKANAKIVSEPADMFWGDRIVILEDPDGYRWTFATNVGDFDPSKTSK